MSQAGTGVLASVPLRERVLGSSLLWSDLTVVAETGSTNEDLVAAARAGAAEGAVLVAERQTNGRGRLGRRWLSEPGTALTFSVLLRPAAVPQSARSWLPLLAGVAAAAGIRAQTGLHVSLKWPNDVLSGSGQPGSTGKLAGILAEQSGDAIVVGTGLNVTATPDGLRSAAAISLAQLGATDIDRAALLVAMLGEFEHWYLGWARAERPGDAIACGLRAEYLRSCCTVGREVRIELPGGGTIAGRACDVDSMGRLVVAGPAGTEPVSAGDVIHVR